MILESDPRTRTAAEIYFRCILQSRRASYSYLLSHRLGSSPLSLCLNYFRALTTADVQVYFRAVYESGQASRVRSGQVRSSRVESGNNDRVRSVRI